MEAMLYYSFFSKPPKDLGFASIKVGLRELLTNQALKDEILQVIEVCFENLRLLEKNLRSILCLL